MSSQELQRQNVVCVICVDQERQAVLLVEQERTQEGVIGWSLPGGTWEIGESAEEAARRETLEETGLEVTLKGLFDSRVEVRETPNGRVATFILTYEGECRPDPPQPQDPDAQVRRAAWVPVAHIDALPFHFPSQRDLIKRYVQERWSAQPAATPSTHREGSDGDVTRRHSQPGEASGVP